MDESHRLSIQERRPPGFLLLPREIRELIWDLYFEVNASQGNIWTVFVDNKSNLRSPYDLRRTCQLFNQEIKQFGQAKLLHLHFCVRPKEFYDGLQRTWVGPLLKRVVRLRLTVVMERAISDYYNLRKKWSKIVSQLPQLEIVELVCLSRTNALKDDATTYMHDGISRRSIDYATYCREFLQTESHDFYDGYYNWPATKHDLYYLAEILNDDGRKHCRVYLLTQYVFHRWSQVIQDTALSSQGIIQISSHGRQIYHWDSAWYRIYPDRFERIATSREPSEALLSDHRLGSRHSYDCTKLVLQCRVCHRTGHSQEWCWLLHPELRPRKRGWTDTMMFWRDEAFFSVARNPHEST